MQPPDEGGSKRKARRAASTNWASPPLGVKAKRSNVIVTTAMTTMRRVRGRPLGAKVARPRSAEWSYPRKPILIGA